MRPSFITDDGGRAAAGFKGSAGDCGVRAAALATRGDYKAVYDALHASQKAFKAKSRRKAVKSRSASPRDGVWREVMHEYMTAAGAEWVPLSEIGGEVIRVQDVARRWPTERIVMRLGKHYSAMIAGTNHDTWEQHPEKRVYGIWLLTDKEAGNPHEQ